MKKLICIVFLSVLGCYLAAQNTLRFNRTYPMDTITNGLATDVISCQGGYMVFGSVNDSISPYNFRVYIMKIDTMGNKDWVKSYGKRGYNYDGFFPLGGGASAAVSGGYIGANYISDSTGSWFKALLFRFDANGDTLWTRTYNDSINLMADFVKRARKNRYIIGATEWRNYNDIPLYVPVLIETDSSGNTLWQKNYPMATYPKYIDYLTGIDTCNDGGFIMATYDQDTDRYDDCSKQIYIIKTDSSGNVQWTKQVNSFSPCNTLSAGITTLRHDGYAVCGYRDSTGPTLYADPDSKLYMVKLNNAGLPVWQKQYGVGGAQEGAVTLTTPYELADGDIMACGDGNFKGHALGCTLKTDSNGNEQWLHFIANDTQNYAGEDFFYDIKPTPDNGFVSCGYVYGRTLYTWVVKTDSLGCADSAGCNYLGIEPLVKNTEGFKLYPNPASTVLNVETNKDPGQLEYIELYNEMGEIIRSATLKNPINVIPINNLSAGVYFYRAFDSSNNLISEGKLVIIRQ